MPRTAKHDPLYLSRLRDHYARHRVFPSYAAIGALLGLRSTSSVAALLRRLQAQRYLQLKDGRVSPGARFFELPRMQSRVAAGAPAEAPDAPAAAVNIDAQLVRSPSKTFLLEVKGDSMIDAGLLPGDTLVVERTPSAQVGDIVVALVDDAYTVKRLRRENGKLVLEPANAAYRTLRPDAFEMVGVVVGSFRRYSRRGVK